MVGDDAQSIYAFPRRRGPQHPRVPQAFEPAARVIALAQNYRSTPEILNAANAVLAEAEEGYAKALWGNQPSAAKPALVTVPDDNGQVDYISREILAAREAASTCSNRRCCSAAPSIPPGSRSSSRGATSRS